MPSGIVQDLYGVECGVATLELLGLCALFQGIRLLLNGQSKPDHGEFRQRSRRQSALVAVYRLKGPPQGIEFA